MRRFKLSEERGILHLTRREFLKLALSALSLPVFGNAVGRASVGNFTVAIPKGLRDFEVVILDNKEIQGNLKYNRILLPVSRDAEPIKLRLEPNHFGNKEWTLEYRTKGKTKREIMSGTWQYRGRHRKGKCRLNIHNRISGYVEIDGFKKYFETIGRVDDKLILISYWQWGVERTNLPL